MADNALIGQIPRNALSRVYAWRGTAQTLATNSAVTIIFDNEVTDTKAEFNNGTGVFTAIETGWYNVDAGCLVSGSTAGTYRQFSLWVGGARKTFVQRSASNPGVNGSDQYHLRMSMTVFVVAGQAIRTEMFHDAGVNMQISPDATNSGYNYITITQLRE